MDLQTLLNDHRMFQDETQCACVLAGRTPWGRYRQAIRELYQRARGLAQIITDREKYRLKAERERRKARSILRRIFAPLTAQEAALELRQITSHLEYLDRQIADTQIEYERFFREAALLHAEYGNPDPARRREMDMREWAHHWTFEAVAARLSGMAVPYTVLQHLVAMPREIRDEVKQIISDPQRLEAWYESQDDQPPIADELAAIDVPPVESAQPLLAGGRLE